MNTIKSIAAIIMVLAAVAQTAAWLVGAPAANQGNLALASCSAAAFAVLYWLETRD